MEIGQIVDLGHSKLETVVGDVAVRAVSPWRIEVWPFHWRGAGLSVRRPGDADGTSQQRERIPPARKHPASRRPYFANEKPAVANSGNVPTMPGVSTTPGIR